jgi:hypothetical protein
MDMKFPISFDGSGLPRRHRSSICPIARSQRRLARMEAFLAGAGK